jgi:preprotein translocase subunit SecD
MEKGVKVSSVERNSSVYEAGLRKDMTIKEIRGEEINNLEGYARVINSLMDSPWEEQKIEIKTKEGVILGLFSRDFIDEFLVEEIPKTRINTGLDIQGGLRILISAENASLSISELEEIIEITEQRLNVYGLSDVVVRPRSDAEGNNYMAIEIAGSSPADIEKLIAQQGKFEAKIGEEIIFIGGNKDITYVGTTGQDAGIYSCQDYGETSACEFRFVIYLSEIAAQKQAEATKNLSVNVSSGGQYLEKQLDLYVDDALLDSLQIGKDLQGRVVTTIQISGSGTGTSEQEAYTNAQENMKKLQTILKTGSLPYKLRIEKTDRISANLGEDFTRTILIAGVLAAAGVFILVFLRYRKIKISMLVLLTMFTEMVIVLGVASLIGWNIDLAGIAGILASIGTGVDDQLVIIDESRKKEKEFSLKRKIKSALAIIVTAYATTSVSLLPLMSAGAGLLAGFATTTLIGITAGILITRPAFGDLLSAISED